MEFRQLLVASIERIDVNNKKLKDNQFSFIAHILKAGALATPPYIIWLLTTPHLTSGIII